MLNRVTITGADDNTAIAAMLELSGAYPWLEWGILVSPKREGSPRYPSRQWCADLATVAHSGGELKLSMHICGSWARSILSGDFNWLQLPAIRNAVQRVQINGTPQTITTNALWSGNYREYILQIPRAMSLLEDAVLERLQVNALFDESGGEGIIPTEIKPPLLDIYCGYAGGIGPDNVVDRVKSILAVTEADFWIDMEGRVRINDILDLGKVVRVLDLVSPYVRQGEYARQIVPKEGKG